MENIDDAVKAAGLNAAGTGHVGALDFNANRGIMKDYEAKIGGLKGAVQSIPNSPVFIFTPKFEQNFAFLDSQVQAGKVDDNYPRDSQKQFGDLTYTYFECFKNHLESDGFGKDDLLQEGFKEAVEKNEVALRVVDKPIKGPYNECIVENGVLYIQTNAQDVDDQHR